MIHASNVMLGFGKRILFKEVNLKFTPGNCYGLIGANGSGKSTFLRMLSGEIKPDKGDIIIGDHQRIAVLKQDQFAFDEHTVLDTVIMGHPRLYEVLAERSAIYAKPDFSDADGLRAAELEGEVAEMNGYEAESDAATLLKGLGLADELHTKLMKDLEGGQKVRVLLAQALFGSPDILLLDEPTNHLDIKSIGWLEEFLINFPNTVIVVSHDRHFLNKVCTHIADIDYGTIRLYVGNYDFWYHASQLAAKQRGDEKRRAEDKAAELKEFIMRFSSNASKAKQATSRKKLLDKLDLDSLPQSSRKFPFVGFKPNREVGNVILEVEGLTKKLDGVTLFKDVDFIINKGDKIVFVGPGAAKTAFFEVITGEAKPDAGEYRWGQTITTAYFPKENARFFDSELPLVDWLQQFAPKDAEVRGFLGRMLFTGEEGMKRVNVCSGGERVRLMLSRMMLGGANVLVLDEPTNHLDLESIEALNEGLIRFPEIVLFTSHDLQFVETIANRVVEFTPGGVIDRQMSFEEYLANEAVQRLRDELWHGHCELSLE